MKNSINAYVEEAILSYHHAFDVMEAAKLELQNKNNKYKAELDYYQSYFEILIWENIIECEIYIDA